jgi:3-phosphoglycerate kinase
MLTKRLIKNTTILLTFIILASNLILAQGNSNDDKRISDLVSTLKQKVLLSGDQEVKITSILRELKSNAASNPEKKDASLKEAQSKLESLLDNKQKMKYDILKNDFWKKIIE